MFKYFSENKRGLNIGCYIQDFNMIFGIFFGH